jgi:alkylation response protein AidB-like acyl-CoA dehydrogenase
MSETIEAFTVRVRAWAEATLTPVGLVGGAGDRVADAMREAGADPTNDIERGRALLRLTAEAGFGGLAFPTEYGGQGLTAPYLDAFIDGVRGYDFGALAPFHLTLGMNAPTMLEFGTEEQKRTWLPRMFDGTDLWCQMLSEPTGGSDLASALTKAELDGEEWVVNGSKVWTSTADKADMAMALVRTNWEVPKHAGLSVLILPMDAPGLTVNPLRLVSGYNGFCQEFFTDVRVPKDNLLGEIGNGWNIATRLLVHERNGLNGGSEHYRPPQRIFNATTADDGDGLDEMLALALEAGNADDAHVRQLVGDAFVQATVAANAGPRVTAAMRRGAMIPQASSILKLLTSESSTRRTDIGMEIMGGRAGVWEEDDLAGESHGVGYLSRQTMSLVSGTSEIQRNIISERVLGLPREPAPDRGVPFKDLPHNTVPTKEPTKE